MEKGGTGVTMKHYLAGVAAFIFVVAVCSLSWLLESMREADEEWFNNPFEYKRNKKVHQQRIKVAAWTAIPSILLLTLIVMYLCK